MSADIGALLFDKDGTLFDFNQTWGGWAREYFLGLCDTRAAAAGLAAKVGFDLERVVFEPGSIIIAATPHEISLEISRHWPRVNPKQIYDDMNRAAAEIAPVEAVPLRPLLTGFRDQGLALGIATNDTEIPTSANLRNLGLTEMFDYVSTSDNGMTPKPAPDSLLAFADQVSMAPGRVAMVGDSLHDLEAGRAAGMPTIAVLTGVAGREELAPMADVVLPDIGHIPAWLERLPA